MRADAFNYRPLFLSAIDPGLDASSGLEGFELDSCLTLKIRQQLDHI